jgi:hypothetical protein
MKTLITYLAGIAVLLSMSAAAAEGRENSAQVTERMTSPGRDTAPNRTAATFELVQGRGKLEAAFASESYRPGEHAALSVWGNARRVAVQIFRTGPERVRTRGNDEMQGVAIPAVTMHSDGRQLSVRVGNWPTGMYFARIRAGGQVAYAPFVVRPRRLGEHRVAVVMPTNTWQAYNFRDDDGDGAADTWYADRRRHTVRIARPHLNHGVPMRFRVYDLPFLHWLAWSKRDVDYLAQTDIEQASGRTLEQRYDLIVFPGHHEYVTSREYEAVTRYRDLGGNLMFLSANNFFWKVERRGNTLHQIGMWRDLGRPEAALVGVQYVTYGSELRGPYVVRNAAPWLFRGTGLGNGSRFGTFGIEIDRKTAASPRRTVVLAQIENGHGSASAGQMAYYETRRGAKVFAAGAFTLAGSATRSYGAQLLENLWRHLARA